MIPPNPARHATPDRRDVEIERLERQLARAREREKEIREEERRSSESSKRRLEAILSGMSDAVLAVDADGRVLFSNEVFTRTFGDGEPGDLDDGARLGRTVPLDEAGGHLAPDDLPQKRATRGESFEMRFALPEGASLRIFEVQGRPIEGADIGGGVLLIRDAGLREVEAR